MQIRYFLVRYLADLQLAILLLLSIAGFSIVGSIIEQNQPVEYYKKAYDLGTSPIFNAELILRFGFDHLFRTWWFISLLVLFGLSLTCCTFLQQLPILKATRKFRFYGSTRRIMLLPLITKAPSISNGSLLISLQKMGYQNFQRVQGVYSNKGIVGRVSPIVVHFSMVLILWGTVLASFAGFVAQEFIPETEVFHVQNLLTTNQNSFVPDIAGRINDFWIVYKEDKTIRQFYTDLSILGSHGEELKRETIYVNHPLKYADLTFYQTDWDILGIRVQSGNSQLTQLPVLKPTKKIWLSWIPVALNNDTEQTGLTIVSSDIRGVSSFYNQQGQLISDGELNEVFPVSENGVFCDFINATGIQIKSDPGLRIIYSGFFLLLTSIITSYISYSQIWISHLNRQMFIGGKTNRAKIQFEFEVLNLGLRFKQLDNMRNK